MSYALSPTARPTARRLSMLISLVFVCLIIVAIPALQSAADDVPCTNPAQKTQQFAWTKGVPVNVVINANQFSVDDFNCLKTAFDNWNAAKGQNGNGSNVTFNVTRSTQTVVTRSANGDISATGSNVYQVNRAVPWTGALDAGVTGGQTNGTTRDNAISSINPGITNCLALTETMAHEIGHTFGLDECSNCADGSSVMTGVPCTETNESGNCTAVDFNDTSAGTSGPTPCDNDTAKQVGQYGSTGPLPSPPPPFPSPNPTPCWNHCPTGNRWSQDPLTCECIDLYEYETGNGGTGGSPISTLR